MKDSGKTMHRKWYCPNCSELVSGVVEYSGEVNLQCRNCGVIMTMTRISRRKHVLTVIMPDRWTDGAM